KVKWEREEGINIGEDRYQEVFRVPQLSDITTVYLVRLELLDENGKVLSNNLYWESSKTPVDFSELSYMKYDKLDLTYTTEETKDEYLVHAKVKNASDKLSFMNRLAIIRNDNKEEVLPSIWNDNFITVFPGEESTVEARVSKKDLNGSAFSVTVDNN
ncbi:MAG: hypothetical protein P4L45_00595, partial [Ignavibacteriaceae bacterium]|nr:hypothetical protein [Ignavibacteriaceae bacterium]